METVINNSEEYVVKDIVDYVDATHGFNGFLVKFQMVHGGMITRPLFIINHRDKFSIQKYYQVITTLITDAKNARSDRGAKWRAYYDFKRNIYLLQILLVVMVEYCFQEILIMVSLSLHISPKVLLMIQFL